MTDPHRISRREFISSVAAGAAFTIVPSRLLGAAGKTPPSEQFCFAQIGSGGKGSTDVKGATAAGARLIAMCDVDAKQAAKTYQLHPGLPTYTDFREMLDKHDKEIDGVIVSTPDHTHAVAALDAIRRGKHVYVQKPLARTVQECQLLLDASRKHGVVTQMGNQGHSGPGLKLWQAMMDAGAFGEIQSVHTWSDRPGKRWPQGMTDVPQAEEPPATLSWERWIGAQAMRPYSPAYLPKKWRGWWDFGCGAMGDMACHNMDPAFWILKLGLPETIKAEASAPAGIAYPKWSVIEYTFPATAVCPKPVKLTWYDGGKKPEKPENSHPELKVDTNGCMVIGSKMTALGGSHAAAPVPIALGRQAYGQAVKDVERHWREELKKLPKGDHYGVWIEGAKAGKPTASSSQFAYAAPMTQAILLGCVALRFPGRELRWDSGKGEFSNLPEANRWLRFRAREGYDMSV